MKNHTLKLGDSFKNRTYSKKNMPDLQSMPVPNKFIQQIWIDNFPEVDGFKHLIVCIDYFAECSEGKAIINNSAPTAMGV